MMASISLITMEYTRTVGLLIPRTTPSCLLRGRVYKDTSLPDNLVHTSAVHRLSLRLEA